MTCPVTDGLGSDTYAIDSGPMQGVGLSRPPIDPSETLDTPTPTALPTLTGLAAAGRVSSAEEARESSPASRISGGGGAAAAAAEGPGRISAAAARALASIGLEGQALNMHVLVVDDMLLMRRQAENFLKQLGCTCR